MLSKLYRKIRLLRHKHEEPYLTLYRILGYYPDNIEIYLQAFLHKSFGRNHTEEEKPLTNMEKAIFHGHKYLDNERLEFLGDALLGAVVGDILYRRYPNKQEGFLTNLRSKIVSRTMLNDIAMQMEFDRVFLSDTQLSPHHNHLYGNALEALVASVYLDRGYAACYRFIKERIIQRFVDIEKLAKTNINYKSTLLEWCQRHHVKLDFNVLPIGRSVDGSPIFRCDVKLADMVIGEGKGYSKKEAQQIASAMAHRKLLRNKRVRQYMYDLRKQNKEVSIPSETVPTDDLPLLDNLSDQLTSSN